MGRIDSSSVTDLGEQYAALDAFENPGATPHMPRVPPISEILPNLWMGGCVSGAHLPDDFRYVVSLTRQCYDLGPNTTRYEAPFVDGVDIPDDVEALAELVNRWRSEGKTLVHCEGGRNRSGLVIALALMRDGYTFDDAVELLRAKRSREVLFNGHFCDWLRAHP